MADPLRQIVSFRAHRAGRGQRYSIFLDCGHHETRKASEVRTISVRVRCRACGHNQREAIDVSAKK